MCVDVEGARAVGAGTVQAQIGSSDAGHGAGADPEQRKHPREVGAGVRAGERRSMPV
jgi:hypothetical protein